MLGLCPASLVTKAFVRILFSKAASDQPSVPVDVKSYIREAVAEGIKLFSGSPSSNRLREPQDQWNSLSSEESVQDISKSGRMDEGPVATYSFDFSLVPSLIAAVKQVLDWEEDSLPPSKQKQYFLKKRTSFFSLIF